MKIKFLLLAFLSCSLFGFGQIVNNRDRMDLALAINGANGSTAGPGATFEIALKPLIVYPSLPVAEDFIVYLQAPQSILTGTETVDIVERNSLFGTGTMTYQGRVDIGSNAYFLFALNAASGLNLNLLTLNTWRYAFTIKITPAPSNANLGLFKLIDRLNNAEISTFAGQPTYTRLMLQGDNELTATAAYLLPASLSHFNVSKQGNSSALLSWTTTSEQNLSRFDLERSTVPNSSWTKFAEVKAKGNSTTATSYTYSDLNVYDGSLSSKVFFYRIRTVDVDKQEKIFPIRSVRFSGSSKEISLYPNPANDGFVISIPIVNPGNNKIRLNMVNRLGQVVHVREISAANATNYFYDLKTPGIISGEYMLQIIYDGELLETKKVIVQH